MKSLKFFSVIFLMVLGFIAIRPAVSYADKAQVAISGYCPVCIIHGEAMKGSNNFVTEYKGKVYKFAGFNEQKAFIVDPEQYTKDLDAQFKKLKK